MDTSEHQVFFEFLGGGTSDADLDRDSALANHLSSCELCRDYMAIYDGIRASAAKTMTSHANVRAAQRRVASALEAQLDAAPRDHVESRPRGSILRAPIALLVVLGMAALTWVSASAVVQPRSIWEALRLPFAEPTSVPALVDRAQADQRPIAILASTAQLGGAPESLFISGDFVYVGLRNQLFVFTIADPASPTLLGDKVFQPQSTDPALSIYVVGHIAYVANWAYGMVALDVSDSADIQVLSQFTYKPEPYSLSHHVMVEDIVAVKDGTAFLVIDECDSPCTDTMVQKSILAVSVVDPRRPTALGSYPLSEDFIGAQLRGDTLFLGDRRGILRIDARDPGVFHELGKWPVPGLVSMLSRDQSIFALIEDAYGHKLLRILDVSDASAPKMVGEASLVIDWWRPSLDLVGKYLLVYDTGYPLSHGQRIEILDVMDPKHPAHLASRYDPATIANDASGYVTNGAVLADNVILRVGGSGRLEVLGVPQP